MSTGWNIVSTSITGEINGTAEWALSSTAITENVPVTITNSTGSGSALTVVDIGAALAEDTYTKINGTAASPTAITSNNLIWGVQAGGQYDTTVGHTQSNRVIGAHATQNWTASNQGSQLNIYTTPNNSTTFTQAVVFDQDQSATFDGNVNIGNSNNNLLNLTGALELNSSAGTTGQVVTSAGSAAIPTWSTPTTGTVTSVSVTTANGVSGTVATSTTTPAITLTLGSITPSAINVSGLTASEAVATDASKNLVSVANTGTGNNVLQTSPTLVTPLLGTPTSGTLTNCTGLPVAGGGTGAATFTADGVLYGNTTSALGVTAAGTTGQALVATTSSAPTWGTLGTAGVATATFTAPTVQSFTSANNLTFTITAGNTASINAVYSNNGVNYTLTVALLVGATTLVTTGSLSPLTSGTLTYVSGTHTGGNITYSAWSTTDFTYTTPTSPRTPLYLKVKMVGGGGGGSASGTVVGTNTATAGGFSAFTSASCNGGNGAVFGNPGAAGGAVTTAYTPIAYGSGGSGCGAGFEATASTYIAGGSGGNSFFGGAGGGGNLTGTGLNGVNLTGAGGGGAGTNNTVSSYGGSGGGAGGYMEFIVTSPTTTYVYAVGGAGSGGSAGTNGNAGGNGGTGYVVVEEYYQ